MNPMLLGSLTWLITLFLRRLEMSGAVPADEFRPAYFGYLLLLPLQIVSLGLFLFHISKTDIKKIVGRIDVLATALIILGVISEYLPLLGVLLLFGKRIVLLGHGSAKGGDSSWPVWNPRIILKDLAHVWLPLLFVTLLLGFGELVFFSGRFFDSGIVREELWLPYALSLAGFATMSALKVLMVFFRLTVITFVCSFLLRKIAPKRAGLFDLVVSLAFTFGVMQLFWQTMKDEIIGLDGMFSPEGSVLTLLLSLILVAALMLAPRVSKARKEQGRFRGIAHLLGQLFVAPTFRSQAVMSFFLLLSFLSFRFLLYPVVEDYRIKLFDTFAQLAVLIGAALLVPLGKIISGRSSMVMSLILTFVGLYASFVHMQRPDVRLIAFEYSRFCALGASAPWSQWFDDQPIVGFHPPEASDPFPRETSSQSLTVSKSHPPIFLIIWDAARPDHLTPYGYKNNTSPNLLALSDDGYVMEAARSTATATTLGIRNMMTGSYSTRFMMSEKHQPFFVYHLAKHGYSDFFVTVTGNDYNGVSAEAFQRSWVPDTLKPNFHFRDFSNTDELKPDIPKTEALFAYLNRAFEDNPTLEGDFHYLHLTGTHTPWLAKNPVREFGNSISDKYDAEIAKVDALLGKLVTRLKKRGVYDDAIIIVTADHGTGLGEHGRFGGFLPYEEQVRIPLIVKVPGNRSGRSKRITANIDIAPTLLDWVGAPRPEMDGLSFADILRGNPGSTQPRALVSFCAFRDGYAVLSPSGQYKLHHYRSNGYEALFDLWADPKETNNLLLDQPAVATDLRLHLDHFLWRGRDRYGNPYHYRDWSLEKEQERR